MLRRVTDVIIALAGAVIVLVVYPYVFLIWEMIRPYGEEIELAFAMLQLAFAIYLLHRSRSWLAFLFLVAAVSIVLEKAYLVGWLWRNHDVHSGFLASLFPSDQ